MATTLLALSQDMQQEVGDFESGTSDGAGSTTTLVDSALQQKFTDDDVLINWWLKITESGHTAEGEVRRITDYTASSGTITVPVAFSATTGSGSDYVLSRYHPNDYRDALNQAIERVIDELYLPIRDETIVVDDRLSNSDFETFSSGFTGWTEVGSPTVTQETSIVFHGSGSAKVVASGAAGQLTQTVSRNVHEITGKQVVFVMWGYTTDASALRVRLDWDGSDIDSSDYHTGSDQWERIRIAATVPSSATQVKAICEVADGSTGYFDAGYLYHVPIHRYTIPSSIIKLGHVLQQVDENLPDGPYLPYNYGDLPTPGRRLRITGKGQLSTLSADSDTVELNAPQTRLLVDYALSLFWGIQASPARSPAQQREGMAQASNYWMERYEADKRRPGMRMNRIGRSRMREVAHVERDSSGNYLVFDQLGRTAGPIRSRVHT